MAARVVVNEEGCHVWQGSFRRDRPQMTIGSAALGTRRPQLVHRVVWEAHHGPRPEGYDVHHACWNKACVNIAHLRLLSHGTHSALHRALDPIAQRARSQYAMHVRWHVNRQRPKADCEFCERA